MESRLNELILATTKPQLDLEAMRHAQEARNSADAGGRQQRDGIALVQSALILTMFVAATLMIGAAAVLVGA